MSRRSALNERLSLYLLRSSRKLIFLVSLAYPLYSYSSVAATTEAELRAAVIVGIMRFTSWENKIFESENQEVQVCLVGQPFSESYLMPISGMQNVKGKPVVVTEKNHDDVSGCQVLVIGKELNRKHFSNLVVSADNASILSVCDGCRADGTFETIINLTLRKQRVNFEVNLAKAKRTGIVLDVQLLELASDVRK